MGNGVDPRTVFAGIGSAKARVAANYIVPSRFIGKIRNIKLDKNRKGETFVVVEITVLKLISTPEDSRGHKVGEEVSHMMMAKYDSFLGNIKAMVSNLFGLPADTVTAEEAIMVCGEDQPCSNMVIEINSYNIKTKEGRDFTQVDYIRSIGASEALEILPEQVVSDFFPNDYLVKAAAVEAQQEAAE